MAMRKGCVLAQSAPAAATLTVLYTVTSASAPGGVEATLIVCNRGAATTVRVAFCVGGYAVENKDYVFYDTPMDANDTWELEGVKLSALDKLHVRSASGDVSFTLMGDEIKY
jgi:hypothetical protein